MTESPDPWQELRDVLNAITERVAHHLEDGESALEYLGEPESRLTVPQHLRAAFQEATFRAVGDHADEPARPRNRYVNAMVRSDLLDELTAYVDDDGLNHVTTADQQPITDLSVLSDDELRDALKRARAMALLWSRLDE